MFANSAIVEMVQKHFIPVAVDVWYEQRRQDAVGEFFYHVVDQGWHKGKDRDLTRQGLYCFTADGQLLSGHNNRAPERLEALFRTGLERFRELSAKQAAQLPSLQVDRSFDRRPPDGGLVVDVYGKILLEGEALREAVRINPRNSSTSRDHLWVTASEVKALMPSNLTAGLKVPFPRGLAMRITRFHLVDNIRGEPPMWNAEHVRSLNMEAQVESVPGNKAKLQLSGSATLATHTGDRTYEAQLLGALECDLQSRKIVRFDMVALGEASGDGTYTRGCPKGRFPLAIAFTLADPKQGASLVPPQGAREINQYLTAQ